MPENKMKNNLPKGPTMSEQHEVKIPPKKDWNPVDKLMVDLIDLVNDCIDPKNSIPKSIRTKAYEVHKSMMTMTGGVLDVPKE